MGMICDAARTVIPLSSTGEDSARVDCGSCDTTSRTAGHLSFRARRKHAIRRTASIGGVAHTHDEYLDGEEDDYDDPDDLDDGESTPDLAALDLGEGG